VSKASLSLRAQPILKSQFLSEIISDLEEFVAIKSQKDHLSQKEVIPKNLDGGWG